MKTLFPMPLLLVMASAAFAWNEHSPSRVGAEETGVMQPSAVASGAPVQVSKSTSSLAQSPSGSNVADQKSKQAKAVTLIRNLGGEVITESELTELKSVCLEGTKITDGGLASFKKLIDLEDMLDLSDTQVTDAGLQQLTHLKKLKHIDLRGTLVTEEGKNALRRALPEVRVFP